MGIKSVHRSNLVVLLPFFFVTLIAMGRSPYWKPERVLGSPSLHSDSIRYIVLNEKPDGALSTAVNDFIEVMRSRGVSVSEVNAVDHGLPKNAVVLSPISSKRIDEAYEGGGFRIRCVRSRIFISAGSDAGLANGLYTICEDMLGARWYWPGEIGLEIIDEAKLVFRERSIRGRPGFVERTLFPEDNDYGHRNKLNRNYHFNHNLANIFSKTIYEKHPEVFAVIDGQRRRPRNDGARDAQPNFIKRLTVELSANAVLSYFVKHPDSLSFSLSINDNSRFDQSSETEAIVSPISYFRLRPNYTDLVFSFMNAVAEEVFDKSEAWQTELGQKRYITAIAYYWTEQSPSFSLHPRVMPVLTSDRAQWHDPKYRDEDQALIRRWADSGAERIATWDYYFGLTYPYPRQFSQWIGESLPYLHEQGVDVFFAQLPSVWGLDGPKAWLAAQLLWKPEQDVNELLDEFYTNFFGAAADPIRGFYEIAEQIRDEREGTANWIKFYKDEAGIELFDEQTIALMRKRIDKARDLVVDDSRRLARVEIVSEAFSLTEAYFDLHITRVELVRAALSALNKDNSKNFYEIWALLQDFEYKRGKFEELIKQLVQKPMHKSFAKFDRIKQSNPESFVMASLAAISSESTESEELDELWQKLKPWRLEDYEFRSLTKNPTFQHQRTEMRNFLGPEMPIVESWDIDYRPSKGLAMVSSSQQADKGLRVENADIVSLDQTFPVIAGKPYLLKIDASWQVSPDNRTYVQLVWKDFSGNRLQTDIPLRIPNGRSDGFQRIAFALQPPNNAYDLIVGIVTNRQYSGDFIDLREVNFGVLVSKP